MTKTAPIHAPMTQFKTESNQLLVGKFTMQDIANIVGQTPFYAYDRQVIENTISTLRQSLPSQIELHYAIKANPYQPVINHMASLVDGFDVASAGEMLRALQTSIEAKNISFAGPGKADSELVSAITAGVTLNVESPSELTRIERLSEQLSITANVALRVNPEFELKSSGMQMTGGPKPFGIDSEDVADLIIKINQSQLNFIGLHIFSGSQNLNPEALIDAHNQTFALASKLLDEANGEAISINIGGGFGIPYFPGERHLPLAEISANLSRLLEQYQQQFKNTKIVMEFGRYLVGPAGVYISKVIDIKQSRDQTFVVTNGGLHHHLSNSGNFGQVIRKNYPVAVANKISDNANEIVTIVGPLCTPLDILANKVKLPHLAIGDLIVVYQSGAYGASASPQQFLGHPALAEILI
jgi:diaminopimelate decarboxylase